MPVPSQLVFDVGVSSLCTEITTIDDGVFEGNETFLVSLTSANANVDVSGSTATVVIRDIDGINSLFTLENFLSEVMWSICVSEYFPICRCCSHISTAKLCCF